MWYWDSHPDSLTLHFFKLKLKDWSENRRKLLLTTLSYTEIHLQLHLPLCVAHTTKLLLSLTFSYNMLTSHWVTSSCHPMLVAQLNISCSFSILGLNAREEYTKWKKVNCLAWPHHWFAMRLRKHPCSSCIFLSAGWGSLTATLPGIGIFLEWRNEYINAGLSIGTNSHQEYSLFVQRSYYIPYVWNKN